MHVQHLMNSRWVAGGILLNDAWRPVGQLYARHGRQVRRLLAAGGNLRLYAPCHLATDGVLQAGAVAAGGWEGEDEEIGAAVEREHIQTRPW